MNQNVVVAIALLVAVPIILYTAAQFYASSANQKVIAQLKTNPEWERGDKVALFTLPSGREVPANYLLEDDNIYVGVDGLWWREFRDGAAPVEVLIKGERYRGTGEVILDDPAYTKAVFARLRPTVPAWLPDFLNGRLVVITVK